MWQFRSPTNFFALESMIVDILLSFNAIISPNPLPPHASQSVVLDKKEEPKLLVTQVAN